uniref:CBM49 domain-containing protein n=1 Tax=Steinernema glaseri TaxID=37863 RepID=A0A1I7ZN17_9BILA
MSKLFLLFLYFVGLHAIVVLPLPPLRTFKGARLTVEVYQETSNCWYAGTDCDVTISFGFLDHKNELRYVIPTPAQKGNAWNRFERGTEHRFKYEVPQVHAIEVEEACAILATNSSGFHAPTYENCFKNNIVTISANLLYPCATSKMVRSSDADSPEKQYRVESRVDSKSPNQFRVESTSRLADSTR